MVMFDEIREKITEIQELVLEQARLLEEYYQARYKERIRLIKEYEAAHK